MQNQSARVVFHACLLAAAAAAQAPVSLESPHSPSGATSARGDANRAGGNPSWLTGPGTGIRVPDSLATADLPQDDDYSLRAIFQQVHGDFLLRRERYNPQIELGARVYPSAEIKDETGNFDLLTYDVDLEFAAPIYPDTYVTFGAYYGARRYMTSDAFQLGDESYYHTGLHFGFGHFLDEYTLVEVRTSPGLWSDLDGTIHSKDFDYPSEVTITSRVGDSFFWKIGAQYSQLFEEAPWLPVIGVHWEMADGFRLDVDLPRSVELSLWPTASTGFLLGVDVQGGQYHVRNSLAQGDQRTDSQVQELVAYVGAMHRMNDHLSMFGRVGLVLSGNYDMGDGTPGNTVEGDLGQTIFAQFGVGIDF